jgi:hypothetical protein
MTTQQPLVQDTLVQLEFNYDVTTPARLDFIMIRLGKRIGQRPSDAIGIHATASR